MNYETLKFERDGNVAIITLNRPEAANSLNGLMSEELVKIATHCDSNPEVRAVVLTGTGKMFCAGGDLHSFAGQGDDMAEYMRYTTTGLHMAIARFSRMNAPYLTAINGMAAGAGFSIAITGDLIFAGESAKFTEAYTRIGVSPDGSSTYFLPRLVGATKAKRLIFMNDILTAQEALEWGLVTEVVKDEELMSRVLEVAHELAAGPTMAFGEAKRLIADTFSNTLETQMELETRAICGLVSHTEDAKTGIFGFANKEKFTFNGR